MFRKVSILAVAALVALGSVALTRAEDQPGKIKVLLITGADVKAHPWKETSVATRDILVATGKFDVKISENLKPLESAAELKPYDVIVYARYSAEELSDQTKQNVLGFVEGGKGFYVQHMATASFPKWPEFGKLCGRYWVMKKSGHGPRVPFEAKVVDDKHPITQGMVNFKTDDELYSKLDGTEPINVLVDAYSDFSKKVEPLVFWQAHGKGRMVQNAFGHDGKALTTPEVKKIVARGVEWAATGNVAP